MAKRGPAKTPTNIAKLRGNPGKRKLNDAEPQGLPADGTPPPGLGKHALDLWHSVAPYLLANGLLTVESVPLLVEACLQYQTARDAREGLDKSGLLIRQGDLLKINPLFSIETKAINTAFRILQNYGVTPSSRTGIVVPPAKDGKVLDSKKRFFK